MKNLFFTLMITLLTLSTGKAAPAMHPLTPKEATLITIAAQTARGNIDALTPALRQALDVGIPLEDLKEILTQLYAYCGFPRSLNALQALMTVANERAVNGLPTTQGCTPSPLPNESSLRFGTENQTKLCGRPVTGPLFDFAPAIDTYLKAHLFGDIFGRDNLDWRTRELATIAALAAMPGVESQLRAHIRIGKQNGLTEAHIQAILETVAGNAFGVPTLSPFPVGQENTAYAQYFSGKCPPHPRYPAECPCGQRHIRARMPQQLAPTHRRPAPHCRGRHRLLSGTRKTGAQASSRRCRRSPSGYRSLARCRSRLLVLPLGHRVQPCRQQKHLA